MLTGFVDILSSRQIAGWAADESAPNVSIDVSIYVDQTKIAQVKCDKPRPDLKGAGRFGEGRHGFSFGYEIAARQSQTRVTVRYSSSGDVVPNGDLGIKNGIVEVPEPPLPDRESEFLRIPMPLSPRELFKTLRVYAPDLGLFEILIRMVLDQTSPQQVYYSVFGKLMAPAEMDHALRWGTYYPRDHLYELMASHEFQRGVVPSFLEAFPEKRRLVFVHIPKCAGTDLRDHLSAKFPALDLTLSERSWTSLDKLLSQLCRLSRYVDLHDTLFVTGHVSLRDYLRQNLIRPSDTVITIVRDPVEMMVSHVNYILTRLEDDHKQGQIRADTIEWSAELNISLADLPATSHIELARRILSNRRIVMANPMCHWLGGLDAETCLRNLTMASVELTDTSRYSRWLQSRWGVISQVRANQSRRFITYEDLSGNDQASVRHLVSEDAKLYASIERALSVSGGDSIGGEELNLRVET